MYRSYVKLFDSSLMWRLFWVLCSVMLIIMACDAFADDKLQTDLSTPLCKVYNLVTGRVGQVIAGLALIGLFLLGWFGKLQTTAAITIIVSMVLMFKAETIVTLITGEPEGFKNCAQLVKEDKKPTP